MDLKIWHNVKNVKQFSQMQYDDVTKKSNIADGRHIENRILAIYQRFIVLKFGILKHNHVQAQVKWPN